ncbi:MAG: hypothetical protein JSV34_03990 [Candidatus Omnitrophota bacterium]|nr:MAG: hypothetical protein JSV34_03990 [Candidatus Omnitrophota bacterium]
MQLIEQLAGGVSHDTKNLIAVILQGSDFLRKKVPEGNKNIILTLNYIEQSAKKMNDMIEILFDFIGSSNIKRSAVNLNYIITTSLFLVKYQLNKTRINVIQDLGKNIPDIKADKNSMAQLFMTLLFNAIFSMPKGGQLKICTYVEGKNKPLIISEFEDTGEKFPGNILNNIFKIPLFSEKCMKVKRLGLEGIKEIVDLQNAKITVQNNKDAGVKVKLMFEGME